MALYPHGWGLMIFGITVQIWDLGHGPRKFRALRLKFWEFLSFWIAGLVKRRILHLTGS